MDYSIFFSQEEFSIKNEVRCGTTFRLHIFQNEWLGVSGDEYRTLTIMKVVDFRKYISSKIVIKESIAE